MRLHIHGGSTPVRRAALIAMFVTGVLSTSGRAQALDKARLDEFFDRLAEKNQAMGTLVLAKDGDVLYARSIGYGQIDAAGRRPLTAASRFRIASAGTVDCQRTFGQLLRAKPPGGIRPAAAIFQYDPP